MKKIWNVLNKTANYAMIAIAVIFLAVLNIPLCIWIIRSVFYFIIEYPVQIFVACCIVIIVKEMIESYVQERIKKNNQDTLMKSAEERVNEHYYQKFLENDKTEEGHRKHELSERSDSGDPELAAKLNAFRKRKNFDTEFAEAFKEVARNYKR